MQDGKTALMHAAANGYLEMVELLILHGARAHHRNTVGVQIFSSFGLLFDTNCIFYITEFSNFWFVSLFFLLFVSAGSGGL
jgi:ankyrin repeat protein